MGDNEPAFAPEWYRAGNGTKTPHANLDGNAVSLPNKLPSFPSEQDSTGRLGKNGSLGSEGTASPGWHAYSNFGRRDKRNLDPHDYSNCDPSSSRRSERDTSWRLKRDVLPRYQDVCSGSTKRAHSFKGDLPSLAAVEMKGVSGTGRISTAVRSWTSGLAEAPVSAASIPRSNSFVKSSRAWTASQVSADCSKTDELAARQSKRLIPLTPSMPKPSGLDLLETTELKRSTRGLDFVRQSKNALRAPAAQSGISRASLLGNFQILSGEKTGRTIISPTNSKDVCGQDASLETSGNPNLIKSESNAYSTSLLPSSALSLSSFGEKGSLPLPQNRNDFFRSLRNKTSVNHSNTAAVHGLTISDTVERSLSFEKNVDTCADDSMINQEQNIDDSGVSNGDGGDASYEEKYLEKRLISQSPEDVLENNQSLCCQDCNCHPVVELDERDKAFLRSLGWNEDAEEEALTPEEIATFIQQYDKLKPYSKFSNRFKGANLSLVQPS